MTLTTMMKLRWNDRNRGREKERKKKNINKREKTKQNKKQTNQNKKKTTKISAYLVINRVVPFSFLSSLPLENNQDRNDDKKQADAHRGPDNFRQIN